jgi:hypothetical protein
MKKRTSFSPALGVASVALLVLPGCAAARLASVAGKTGSVAKVAVVGKAASAGKLAGAAKVGVAAEGAAYASRAAHGGDAALAATRVEQAGSSAAVRGAGTADEGAQAARVASEAPEGSRLGDAAEVALDLTGIEVPESGPETKTSEDPQAHLWRLRLGRSLVALRRPDGVHFALSGFRANSTPQVEATLEAGGEVARFTSKKPYFVFPHPRVHDTGARLTVKLRSGSQVVALTPWVFP